MRQFVIEDQVAPLLPYKPSQVGNHSLNPRITERSEPMARMKRRGREQNNSKPREKVSPKGGKFRTVPDDVLSSFLK